MRGPHYGVAIPHLTPLRGGMAAQVLIDTITGETRTWAGATLTALARKWPDVFNLDVMFSGGQLGEGATGELVLSAKSDGSQLAKVASWSRIGSGSSAYYRFKLDLDTVPVRALFEGDASLPSVAAQLEIRWLDGDTDERTTTTLDFTILRSRNVGAEAVPVLVGALRQRRYVDVAEGQDTVTITFDPPMSGIPLVLANALVPAGESPVYATALQDTATAESIDVKLSGDAPAGTKILYDAEVL